MKAQNLSTRIFAVVLFVICGVGVYLCKDLTPQISYEPLGPRPFPLGALALIAFCAVLLFFFGDRTEVHWGDSKLWRKNILLTLIFIVYFVLFERVGFSISTAIFVFLTALIFDGKVKFALPFAVVLGIALYYAFDRWFEVTLPLGYFFN